MDALRVACLSMDAGRDLEVNCRQISAGIQQAAAADASLLLTPECALSGYPGAARDNFDDINWCSYDGCEDLLHTRAQQAGIALILGSISSNGKGGIYNDALACGDEQSGQRYHKRCLTPFDKNFFIPGNQPLCIRHRDWQLGLTVCFDVRFPHTFGDLVCAGADVIVNIAHMAGPDPDPGVKDSIVPQHYASRAAEWATPVVLCNTAHPKRWLGNGAWDARGMPLTTSGDNDLQIFDIPHRSTHDEWYQLIYQEAVTQHGKQHS